VKLEARGVEFAYANVQVLFGVDLSVDDGEMVALLGTNGAGKSSLLAVLAGLHAPAAGRVLLDGEDVTGADPKEMVRRGVVLVERGRAIFGDLTVMENLLVGLHRHRLRPVAARARAKAALAEVPALRDLGARRAGTLSGGEQQQLAIAKGMLAEPAVLLVDELSLGLGPQACEAVRATIRDVNASGTSVVVVEQSLDAAAELANRAVFLERGAVKFDGTMRSLRRRGLARAVFLESSAS
jgi:ABC-type branched-subunit amino acid transport system ATPase component